ncbi:MAG TPA: hypothetical protein VFS91_00215 [Nitrobacter sp.]|nr:hypothetical protein [Nitrobacter sp.]
MKRPTKSAAELEALIRVEMEELCAWPTEMAVSVQPDGDIWKASIMWGGRNSDENLIEIFQSVVNRLRLEFDLAI